MKNTPPPPILNNDKNENLFLFLQNWKFNPKSSYLILDLKFNVISFDENLPNLLQHYSHLITHYIKNTTHESLSKFNASKIIDDLLYIDPRRIGKTVQSLDIKEDLYACLPINEYVLFLHIITLSNMNKEHTGYLIEFLDIIPMSQFNSESIIQEITQQEA